MHTLHLSIRARLGLMLAAFMIPIGVLSYQFCKKFNEDINFSALEIKGLLYFEPMLHLMDETEDYQIASLRHSMNDADAANEMEEGQKKIDALYDELEKNYRTYGADLKMTQEDMKERQENISSVAQMRKTWEKIRISPYNSKTYEALLEDFKRNISVVAKNSGMILDPELDSYSLAYVLTNALPGMLYELNAIKSAGYVLLKTHDGKIPPESMNAFTSPLFGVMKYHLPNVTRNVETASQENAPLKNILDPALAKYTAESQKAISVASRLQDGAIVDPFAYVQTIDVMHDGTGELGDVLMSEFKKLIETRVRELTTDRNVTLGSVFFVVALSLAGFAVIGNGLSRSASRMASALEKIADGDVDDVIRTSEGTDEISRLANAAEKLRVSVADAYMLKQMVKDMPANVMTASVRNGFAVNYVNDTLAETLKRMQGVLPFSAEAIVGTAITAMHPGCGALKTVISDPGAMPYKTKTTIGSEIVDVTLSAVRNKKGDYVAVMATWNVVTAKEKLAHDFERDVKTIAGAVVASAARLSNSAETMAGTVKANRQKAGEATEAASQTTCNVQSVAAATEELSSSVTEISSQLQKTNMLVQQSSQKAINADALAEELKNASSRVSEVTELIANISGQINLLALNATIESARAGDAGKGFAVVAGEVKNLAGQTDKSVAEIQSVISQMQKASGAITFALSEIKTSIIDISSATSNVSAAVEEQSATTNEISRNMSGAADSTRVISHNLENVSNASERAATSSTEICDASKSLSSMAENLNAQVDGFLIKMRAG
ncbi:MAG: methyl-accepting chemotaxis protein [Rickettsiales bacterium]